MQLNITIGKIKKIIEGECSLDDSFLVKNIASLESAQECDVAVLFDRGDRSVFGTVAAEKIKNSNAGLFLAKNEVVAGKNYFITQDPLGAYHKILAFLQSQQQNVKNLIDQTAVVSEKAIFQDGVSIEPYAVIQDGAQIGKNSFIGAHAYIGKNVTLGNNVKIYPGARVLDRCIVGDHSIIHSGAVVGSDGFGYSVTKTGLRKIPQVGIVRIGAYVEIGANSCIDRATFDQTVIGNGVKIDNFVHISHNVHVGDHTAILAQTIVAGSVKIGIGCQIGGHVAIKDNLTIGNGAKIVSKSAVMRNVEDGKVMCGVPSVPFSDWKRMSVILYKLPDIFKEFKKIKTFLEKRRKGFWGRFFG